MYERKVYLHFAILYILLARSSKNRQKTRKINTL